MENNELLQIQSMNVELNEKMNANAQDLLSLDKKGAEITVELKNHIMSLEPSIAEKLWQYVKMLEEINNGKNSIYSTEKNQSIQLIGQLNIELEKRTGIDLTNTTKVKEEGLPTSGVFKI